MQIRSLRPKLKSLLKQFDECFSRRETRGHLSTYVDGQSSDLPRKNCEPIADAVDMPPRTLQQFLSLLEWDHGLMKTKLQQLVASEHGPMNNAKGRLSERLDEPLDKRRDFGRAVGCSFHAQPSGLQLGIEAGPVLRIPIA